MITEQMRAAARHWLIHLSGDTSPQAREKFEDWMRQDPSHGVAYENASRIWGALGEMRHLAPLADEPATSRVTRIIGAVAGSERRSALALSAILVCSVLLWFGYTHSGLATSRQYVTAVAEVRSVTLADGSMVTLGARSKIKTLWSPTQRRVLLTDGEAIFNVAKDPTRAFIVVADGIAVRAVGTQFEVHCGASQVRVAVLEGTVEVVDEVDPEDPVQNAPVHSESGAPRQEARRVTAGQQIIAVPRAGLSDVVPVVATDPASWREGTLRYTDASLAEIIADASRYYGRRIVLRSPGLAELRLTTAFGVSQVDQLLDSLPGVLPVRIDRSNPAVVYIAALN